MKKKISRRFKKLITGENKKQTIHFDEALKLVKKNCTTKFDESIDISLMLNLKQKKKMPI